MVALRRASFANFVQRLTTTPDADARYVRYLLSSKRTSEEMGVLGNTTTGLRNLNGGILGALTFPGLPVEEQRAIADYLDTETARIDALIAKKQQLVRVLEERWNGYVRFTLLSGADLMPLKRGWHVVDCKHRTPTYTVTGFPVVSPGDATPGRLDLSRCHRFVGSDDFDDLTGGGRRPMPGEIVYSRNASIGIACYVDTDEPFCMGQDVCVIRSSTNSGLYLTYVLNSLGVDQLAELKLGSTFSRVNISQIVELLVPLPSAEAQAAVASGLDRARRVHDQTLKAIEKQVMLLAEHRQALITSAVTGQHRVPGVA